MIRMMVSSVLSFILLVVESYIVMGLKEQDTIYFGGIAPFVTIWAMNFFFVFSIMTHIHFYLTRKREENTFPN